MRCSFEDNSACGWAVDSGFNLTQAHLSVKPPFRDHTVNDAGGHYMMMDTSAKSGVITSTLLKPSAGCQVSRQC